MTAPTEAQVARLEIIARRLVIGQLEHARDCEMSTEGTTAALQDLLKNGELDDILQVIWFLSFFAAAGMLADNLNDQESVETAIEACRHRIGYLASIGGIS